jgi:hypothetical protein
MKTATKQKRDKKTGESVNARNQKYIDGNAQRKMKERQSSYIAATHPKIAGGQREINEYIARNPVRHY